MLLRKRQSWTVVWEQPTRRTRDRYPHGRVKITESDSGQVRELEPGEVVDVDSTLYLSPMEGGWDLLP